MSNYVLITYNNNKVYLAKLSPTNYYCGIFRLKDLTNRYYTRDNGKDLYVNSDLKVCGFSGASVCNYSVVSVNFVTHELISKLKNQKKELKEIQEMLTKIDSNVLQFLKLDLDLNKLLSIENIITEFESLTLTNKSASYAQYETLFKNSDKPILCKVSNNSNKLVESTVFKLIKKDFNLLADSFLTVDNEKYLHVEPLEYRSN